MGKPKKHYYILLDGEYMGQTWAVSEEKARNNFWWKAVKEGDVYTERYMNPSDFEAVCVH